MIRCSRAMSCAEARRLPSGGRRSAQRRPAASVTAIGEVRAPAGDPLEGERRLGAVDVVREPAPRRARRSIPSLSSVASSAMAANPMRAEADHSVLLVDFGGVLTTSIWDGFAAFCRGEGPGARTP